MKTVTNYAEKKAKQFLNLLQGYTKGIRMTAILILLLLGVVHVSAANMKGGEVLYLKPNSNWTSSNAWFAMFLCNGTSGDKWVKMTKSGDYYMATVPTGDYKNVIFCRMNNANTTKLDWSNRWNQTADLSFDQKKNCCTITGWDKSSSWSTYQPVSNASLTSSAANIYVGGQATLTAQLSSNTNVNTLKSTSYAISPNTGASISGNTFTATAAGTYTVTATITYYPTGCTSLTSDLKTATATATITVANPPANSHNITYNNGAGWTYGAKPTSAKEGAAVTFEVIPTTGYTVTVTSSDVSLSKNGNIYTFTMPTKDVTINVSATENTHDVTISYKCGDQTIQANGTATAVGEITAKEITAPEITGYKFTSWTLGSGIQSANTTANPISITTKASGDYTLTANYTKMVTVYLINNSNWAKVYAYGWKNGEAQGTPAWPGAEITANKLAEKYEGYDVYSYKVEEGSYDNIIFNNNSGKQTETFAWTDGKYYYAVDPLGSNVYLAGDMTNKDNWDVNKKEFRKATNDATIASVTVTLAAQTYKFKLVVGGAWKGNTGTMQRGGDAVHEGGWSFDKDGYDDNCQIVADIAGDYTFTWDLNTKKLTVAYPPLPKHQVNATVNPAETGTVTGMGEYEEGSTATLVAAPAANYAFKNWTEGGEVVSTETTYTFTVTEAVELVANFEKAQEETHTVTVSYMCNTTSIKDATTPSVGVKTPVSIEAPVIEGYTFQSWTIGDGIKTDNANTDNPISITTKPTGPYTLTANYTENPYVYFVNTARWATIYAYAWKDAEDNGWPGKAMTKEPEKISGFDVYKYVKPTGKNYDKLIFNQGNDNGKTGDLDWEDGKYYVYSAGQWVDKNEVADLLPKPVIYFKNNPGWKEVYVYFLTEERWDATKGAGSKNITHSNGFSKMEKVGETDIYKFDYSEKDFVPGNVIAFTENQQDNYEYFHNTKAAYRTDFNSGMELYIPQEASNETKNSTTKYYNKGLWMKYNSTESGYTITGGFNSWNQESDKFTSETSGGYIFQKELLLSSGSIYEFKIKNIKNDWFRTATAITSTENTDIEFIVEKEDDLDKSNVTIKALSDGYYIFSIDLSTGQMLVSVEYPLMVGDYQMVYVENEVLGEKPYAKFHPAQSIRGITEGEKLDTVSFFINKTKGKNPAILLQRCSEIDGATITWEDIAIQYINGNSRANPAAAKAPAKKSAELNIGDGCPAVTKDAVYNFVLEQTNTGSHKAQILAENTHLYEGNYYIRTDGAAGGWSKYNTNPDNIMTHSQTALTHGGYDYYFCEWMLKGNNVKYVVANDYSYCVSDTLAKDDIVTDENGNLPADANVRYTWNSSTNALARAYLAGSGIISDRYLVLVGDANLQDLEGNTFDIDDLNPNEANFKDMGNWQYQLDVKANQNTLVKLTADYNKKTQYFKGSADDTEQLIKGSENYYALRLIYDFKTNYLVSGLVGNQVITDNLELEEVMIVRSHHEEAQTLKISGNGRVTANKAYGVMTFNKSTLNGAGSEHERALYWVSFPFDVKLDEAFGFGNYGEHWIMEYYDGAERAEKGLWKEPTYSYWKYITDPTNSTLKAGQGYVLCLDLALLGNNAEFWKHDNTEIALYFPSNGKNTIVINNQATQRETTVPKHTCTIERDDRDIEDSNWNIIGVPAYTKIAKMVGENISYYQYNAADNTYVPDVTPNFNTMHAYMVQFAGTINWTEQATSIAALAARKSPTSKDQYTLRLALQQEGADHDHTFIRLQEDNATAEFDMNYDLCKIINRGANIYSMINNVEVAANVLPIEERVIPLGLDIAETGNYTFAMPDGTDGITAILIDYETGKETNLLLADYTTELREGTNNERFALRVRPNHVATEVETIIDGANGQIQKYIINGALYILNNGQLYDAQGRMVQP